MAERSEEKCTLGVQVRTGVDEAGKAITKTRNIQNVNPDITDSNALLTMQTYGSLQKYTVTKTSRTDYAVLTV